MNQLVNFVNSINFRICFSSLLFCFFKGSTNIQILKQYYIDAYHRIRNVSDCLLSVAPLLYQQSPYAGDWADFMRPPQYTNIVHEWHRYQIWGFEVR